jgi:iduronate 2-sulfatase
MIIVDDLRPDLRSAGESFMHTPNIDRLAKSGVSFERAYCQQAICGPTRNSFLSGRRPQRTKAWNFINHFREAGPDWVSFPQYFKERGYTTLATGKTFHPNLPPNWDQPYSWSTDEPYYFAPHAYPSCSEWCVLRHRHSGPSPPHPPLLIHASPFPTSPTSGRPKSLACPTDEPLDTFADWLDMNVSRTQVHVTSLDLATLDLT